MYGHPCSHILVEGNSSIVIVDHMILQNPYENTVKQDTGHVELSNLQLSELR